MRGVLLHGALALAGLLLAYQTWTRKPEDDGASTAELTVLACTEANLQSIKLEMPTHLVDVAPRRTSGLPSYWITTRRKKVEEMDPAPGDKKPASAKPAANVAADSGAPPNAPATDKPGATPAVQKLDPTVPRGFLTNASFKDYVKRVTPLRAVRALGPIREKLADFGLDAVGTRITVACGGKSVQLEVGARTFGTGQLYLRDAKSKDAYLFDDAFVSDLESAQFKFMQTELHAFAVDDVDEAKVTARGIEKRLLQRDKKLGEQGHWVDASAPTKRNELYNNWFARLRKLRVREYLPEGTQPGAELAPGSTGAVTTVVTIEYTHDGKPSGRLELVRVQQGSAAHYYARTETTQGFVTLYDSAAKELESDVGLVMGLEDAAAAESGQSAEPVPSPH